MTTEPWSSPELGRAVERIELDLREIKSDIKKSELKPGETGAVELSITPTSQARILSGYVHIQTSHAQKKEITIPVYGSGAK